MTAILWLRSDLRIEDNRAFNCAYNHGIAAVVFIDESPWLVAKTARRLAFETATLDRLAITLRSHGIACRRLSGPAADALPALCAETGADTVVANQKVGDALEFAADQNLRRSLCTLGINLVETPNDGIRRGRASQPNGFIDLRQDVIRKKARQPHPFTEVLAFLKLLPGCRYVQNMWVPVKDEQASSHLSMRFASGAVATDRVLYELSLLTEKADDDRTRRAYNKFAARLHWRRSFIQDFEDKIKAYPTAPVREERPDDTFLLAAWLAGKTGIPMVDAAMNDLTRYGWINFRLRQIVASCAIDLLDLDWLVVGRALGALFDDYEPGIHWPQIALQAGKWTGRGPRILNPIKQGSDLDPEESWVRSRLPELASVPTGFAHAPWNYDAVKYAPLVDPLSAARRARARYPAQSHAA